MNVTVTLVTYCCEEKRQDPTPLPAVARYLDPRIKTVWERAQSERRPMLILSGLLGLLRPETPIMWYDRQLTPQEVGPLVDLVAHQLLAHGVAAVEYVTQNVWLSPAVKPYHDLLAAACQRQGDRHDRHRVRGVSRSHVRPTPPHPIGRRSPPGTWRRLAACDPPPLPGSGRPAPE